MLLQYPAWSLESAHKVSGLGGVFFVQDLFTFLLIWSPADCSGICISRELNQKQNSLDLNKWPNVMLALEVAALLSHRASPWIGNFKRKVEKKMNKFVLENIRGPQGHSSDNFREAEEKPFCESPGSSSSMNSQGVAWVPTLAWTSFLCVRPFNLPHLKNEFRNR